MRTLRHRVRCLVIAKPFTIGYHVYAYAATKAEAIRKLKRMTKKYHIACLDDMEYKLL